MIAGPDEAGRALAEIPYSAAPKQSGYHGRANFDQAHKRAGIWWREGSKLSGWAEVLSWLRRSAASTAFIRHGMGVGKRSNASAPNEPPAEKIPQSIGNSKPQRLKPHGLTFVRHD